MKLEKEPLPTPQEAPGLWEDIYAKDKAYWDTLTSEFLAREEFHRNKEAQTSPQRTSFRPPPFAIFSLQPQNKRLSHCPKKVITAIV